MDSNLQKFADKVVNVAIDIRNGGPTIRGQATVKSVN